MMKDTQLINFLKKEKKEEKYFICILIILIYLLVFQCFTNISSINNLKKEVEEINKNKALIQCKNSVNNEKEKSTLMKDLNKVFDLLGNENIEQLLVENNKIEIKGKCKKLSRLQDLKSMDNIKNFSVTSIKRSNEKFYFHVTYEIGGIK